MSHAAVSRRAKPVWHDVQLDSPFLDGQAAFVLLSVLFIASCAVFLPNPGLIAAETAVRMIFFGGLSLFFALSAHVLVKFAQTRSMHAAADHAFNALLTRGNLARVVPTVLLVAAFMFTFPSFKAQIHHMNAYAWDMRLADFDRFVHFGHAPWELIASVTGYGWFTAVMDGVYYLWFPVIFISTAAVALIPGRNEWRHRYLLSFILSWIVIGCFLAVAYASVGPIFFDRLYGGASEFTLLTSRLEDVNRHIPLNSLQVRDYLWQDYLAHSDHFVSGISAMPSMHNAISVLMFLAARHAGKMLAWCAGLFALTIFLGSVHLGWHYAVDGYVSALVVAGIWKFTGWHVKQSADPL